jgi:hypothetical protein
MKAVLCPVCSGSGQIKDKRCHGCDGLGWVSVQEDIQTPYISPPTPYVPNIYPYTIQYPFPYHFPIVTCGSELVG